MPRESHFTPESLARILCSVPQNVMLEALEIRHYRCISLWEAIREAIDIILAIAPGLPTTRSVQTLVHASNVLIAWMNSHTVLPYPPGQLPPP